VADRHRQKIRVQASGPRPIRNSDQRSGTQQEPRRTTQTPRRSPPHSGATGLMDRAYAPIFARLEREIAALEAERDLMDRARAVVSSDLPTNT